MKGRGLFIVLKHCKSWIWQKCKLISNFADSCFISNFDRMCNMDMTLKSFFLMGHTVTCSQILFFQKWVIPRVCEACAWAKGISVTTATLASLTEAALPNSSTHLQRRCGVFMGRSCASDKAQLRVTENPWECSSLLHWKSPGSQQELRGWLVPGHEPGVGLKLDQVLRQYGHNCW